MYICECEVEKEILPFFKFVCLLVVRTDLFTFIIRCKAMAPSCDEAWTILHKSFFVLCFLDTCLIILQCVCVESCG